MTLLNSILSIVTGHILQQVFQQRQAGKKKP